MLRHVGFFILILLSMTAKAQPFSAQMRQLEQRYHRTIGVYVYDSGNGHTLAYRANTLFPVQSTAKVIAAAHLLKRAQQKPGLLNKRIHYGKSALVAWHPVTGLHCKTGMTLGQLATASLEYSDNPAFNLMVKQLGGLPDLNRYAHTLGSHSFTLSHYEADLNSNPNINKDVVTPKDMAVALKELLLGNKLSISSQSMLLHWMRDNTTGNQRIRAGVPVAWAVADKTGSGSFGVANDVGLVWSPEHKPVVLAIYTVASQASAPALSSVIAKITAQILQRR